MLDKFENGTLTMKTKHVFCPRMKTNKMFCVHTKTTRGDKNAPLSMRISRHWARHELGFHPTSPHSALFERCCRRQRGYYFFNLPTMSSCEKNTEEEKTKPKTFYNLMTRWDCCWMSQSTTKLRKPLRMSIGNLVKASTRISLRNFYSSIHLLKKLQSCWIYDRERLGQWNHMTITTSPFLKSSVFKMFSVHTNTASRRV